MMVAVVIPSYQMERWIVAAIGSVLGQRGLGQVIVVDDVSTDATVELATTLLAGDDRAVVVTNAHPAGVSGARNTGLELVSTPWVLFLDADDVLRPGALGVMLDAVSDDHVAVLGCFEAIDEHDQPKDDSWSLEQSAWLAQHGWPADVDLPQLCRANIMPPPGGMMLSTEAARRVGGFDEVKIARGGSEDFEFLARVSALGRVAAVKQIVLSYRRREHSQSSISDHHRRRARSRLMSLRRAPRRQRPAIGAALAARYGSLAGRRIVTAFRHAEPRQLGRASANLAMAGLFLVAGLLAVALPAWRPNWSLRSS
jgi:glycosyltransferase involved in cell wall biosynthesis